MWNPACSLLVDGIATDLDQVGSAPRILQWACKHFRIRSPCLDDYLANREEFHKEFPGPRRKIKQLINIIFNKGDEMKGLKYKPLIQLETEIKRVQGALYQQKDLEWLREKFDTTSNPFGKFTAHLTQSIEAKLTLAVMEHCTKKGLTCNAMKHDGVLINGLHEGNNALLLEFTEVCNTLCPGMNMEWKWKALDFEMYDAKTHEPINTLEIPQEFQYTPEIQVQLEEYEPSYEQLFYEFSFINGEPARFRVYSTYVDMCKDIEEETQLPIIAILNPKQFKEAYRSLVYFTVEKLENGKTVKKEKPFIDRWMSDKNLEARYLKFPSMRLTFKRFAMCFNPANLKPDEVNTWAGFAGAKYDLPPMEEAAEYTRRFLNHVYQGCGSVESYNFLIDWCAHMLQYPETKIGIMLCLVSTIKGCGKTTIFELLKRLVGKKACMQTNHSKDICGDNNSRMLDRYLIRLVETRRAELAQNFDSLKSTITDEEIRIRSLYEAVTFMRSYHRFFCDTNYLDAIPDTKGERRFFVVQWQPVHTASADYYTPFYDEIVDNPRATASIFYYLMQRKIKKHYTAHDIPISGFQSRLRAANRNNTERFVESIVLEHNGSKMFAEYTSDELKEKYTEFRRDDQQYRTDQVMRILELNGVPGVTKRCAKRSGHWVTLYAFDLQQLQREFGHFMEEPNMPTPVADVTLVDIELECKKAFGLIQPEVEEEVVEPHVTDHSWVEDLQTKKAAEPIEHEHETRMRDNKRKHDEAASSSTAPKAKSRKEHNQPVLSMEEMRALW